MKTSKMVRVHKVLAKFFIFFLQIYWYKLSSKPEAEWKELGKNIGKRFRKTLFELEGLFIKVGQIISSRADLLPHPIIREELRNKEERSLPNKAFWKVIQLIQLDADDPLEEAKASGLYRKAD